VLYICIHFVINAFKFQWRCLLWQNHERYAFDSVNDYSQSV